MMKRVWRISEFQKCINTRNIITKPSLPLQFIRHVTQSPGIDDGKHTTLSDIVSLFSDKWSRNPAETILKKNLREKVSKLKDELLTQNEDPEKIEKVLEENGVALFRIYSDGSAVVELLFQLKSFPYLAMEVFSWRRKQLDYSAPMTVEEYAKGIAMAGRLKNIDLALELFKEASNKQLMATSLFNALMSAYTYNGLAMRCQSLFRDLKMESTCSPSIVTYNILISAFGRLMLVDHMEATLREVKDLNIPPTVNTYKGLIAGYITAWKWEEMEKTYRLMKAGPIKPDIDIHLLMLRGYAHSGKLERMEEIYDMVRDHVDQNEIPLIRTMICAYCRNSRVGRVEKVDELLRLIPEDEYRPWLNVILICLYAREDLLDQMENSIKEAFEHKAYVTTVGVMTCIISSYFRQNAVDKLADFVQRAECAGWKICRSLYHCKMVMYSSEKRLSEMERVLCEMERVNMRLSKKTFWILIKAYKKWGQRSKLEQVVGMMCKHGYGVPLDACNL
ncbi:hypothetical protein ABFS82_14G195500 [Erythranthe guttata]|uniref:Pentacotripeptide-repeat region of PRORP domain-containing protein n=1 Tax=Erythranthe guttata TaxID=4155 RepID=A0A022RGW4_ERYGU|nr:PREDICTED: pentatricopeptide repeat-containing protein At2g30780-like [Erythranthe guttata]EYU38120.1 hypothetical protein MIMGU_mgv1a004917mg [Erythranthe guttata]|eukprot:XP_012836632.1 PREDICTED: pentatricopeptide repeat-containing protein At2g30780-like [Erythranthe guttata]